MPRLPNLTCCAVLALAAHAAGAATDAPRELHQRLELAPPAHARDVVLTLDACGGAVDRRLVDTLVRLHVPATVFATRRWIDRNPAAVRELLAHPDLFEIENHGSAHVPAVVGRRVYGLAGPADVHGVEHEVADGAARVAQATGHAPHWYRGAGAAYDAASLKAIDALGYRIAGFSVNADGGATLPAATVAKRLRQVVPGDIVIAHMNKPQSGTATGFAQALPNLLARGITFVRLSQAAGVRAAP